LLTRLGYYADRVLELGWLAAAVMVPLFFNVYTSRVFEPDKISQLRSLVLIMAVAWLVKLLEGGWRAYRESDLESRPGKVGAAVRGAAESGLPSWLGFLRVPMIVPIFIYALAYLISTIFTVTPDATLWGSYQRLQGTYSQYSYMLLGLIVIANMRTRAQLERLISFMLLTSLPVALYGILQAMKGDPLPWAGDTSTRVASSMGNAIFVAAWLIMVVPFTIYRFLHSVTGALPSKEVEQVVEVDRRGRSARRARVADLPSYGWAVVTNCVGVLLVEFALFYFALKLMAGLPFPDARMWFVLPFAIAVFYFGCWAIEWLGKRQDDPAQTSIYMRLIAVILFVVLLFAFVFSWSIDRSNTQALNVLFQVEGLGLVWVFFFLVFWAVVGIGMYILAGILREAYADDADRSDRVVPVALTMGYALLFIAQIICIYLTQSRGPWLGLGAGLVVTAVSLWLIGRRRQVHWMSRIGGIVSAITLVLAIFVAALNIPGSPLQSLGNLPLVGRGIERLSTLTRTEDGTGKVRELIWLGATNLILSNPARAVIGWGPEAMYVAYSPFYPADLAHVELRNATPDRSHNVEFDQMVTMGVLGLIAYYFLVGAFFLYGIRIAKRATKPKDQLLAIALISVIASHFIEIQTGIQIAATWTYFYLMIGMMVAFGYFMTSYLRPGAEAVAAESLPADYADDVAEPMAVAVPASASLRSGAAQSRPLSSGQRQTTVTMASLRSEGGNGRPSGTDGARGKSKSAQQARASSPPGHGANRGRDGKQSADAKRRQSQLSAQNRYAQVRNASPADRWVNNPVMLVLYVIIAVAALFFIWTVNVATVQADTLYKQGQAYDSAQRWPESISLYQSAIALQPNQDYYYLFLGRAWLEFTKQVDQEQYNVRKYYESGGAVQEQYKAQTDRDAEKVIRLQRGEQVLLHAHDLNPLNTDHYANLGRLYLYWADPEGAKDPSRAPLAVQYMQLATQRTPGNAQLWDELAVAYDRNNQFSKAIETLDHSRQVDATYARTPFIEGQLYQERAQIVRAALESKSPLPTDGETDYGKLILAAGQALSDTIGLDVTQLVDASYQSRMDVFWGQTQPFTATNSTLDPQVVRNVPTSTVMLALQQQLPGKEKGLADFLRSRSAYSGSDNIVPDSVLQSLWQNPAWAGISTSNGALAWLDGDMSSTTHAASLVNYALGYLYAKAGDTTKAKASYTRALTLEPSNQQVQQALKGSNP
jgi:tetratricopeptide (TPR) repeat protein/O-antigen ligase